MDETNGQPPVAFRQIHLTEPTLNVLGAHALTLQDGNPARAAIRLILHRASKSPRFTPKIADDADGQTLQAAA